MLARCPPNDLDTILETIRTPVFVAGSPTEGSTPVLSANGRLLSALGGLPLSDLTTGLEADLELCRSGTIPVETDHVVLLAKGAERWHLVLAPVVLDGAVVRILVTVADRRPACSPDGVHPETRISAIVEDQAGLICRYDRETRLTFVNGAYARRFGIEPAKLVGRRIADLLSPDEFTPVKEALAS